MSIPISCMSASNVFYRSNFSILIDIKSLSFYWILESLSLISYIYIYIYIDHLHFLLLCFHILWPFFYFICSLLDNLSVLFIINVKCLPVCVRNNFSKPTICLLRLFMEYFAMQIFYVAKKIYFFSNTLGFSLG